MTTDHTALAPIDPPVAVPVVITGEQVDLIRATIAKDATDAELDLFFFDCRRRGVHPLDKLIHFTKRGGKYTPVTSIDFLRSRAADTHEHIGTDDARFVGTVGTADFAATVCVYRLVQGQRCAFTSTARWTEYCPEGDARMWRKMPHTMLAKCAEALALRKAFPQQLAALYVTEELDQASRAAAPPPEGEHEARPAHDDESHSAPPTPPPSRRADNAEGLISVAQARRLFAIAKGAGWSDGALRAFLANRGYAASKQIVWRDYDAIIRDLEAGPPAADEPPPF